MTATLDSPASASAHIAEAVVDVRVADLGACALGRLADFGGSEYPSRRDTLAGAEEYLRGFEGLASHGSREANGYRFASADCERVVQVRRDGFAFSQLPTYGGWSDFYPRARQLWQRYAACVGQVDVVRLGLRYIHHIRMPAGEDVIDKYLTVRPEIPQDELGMLSGFFMAADLPLPDKGAEVRIVETGFVSDDDVPVPVLVLDFDVSKTVKQQAYDSCADAVWLDQAFDDLHAIKDELLHKSITDDTRRLLT